MRQYNLMRILVGCLIGAATLSACSSSDDVTDDGGNENQSSGTAGVGKGNFFIAVKGQTQEYIMRAESLDNSDVINIKDNSYELKLTDYTWLFKGNHAVGLVYQFGDPGVGAAVSLKSDGSLAVKDFNVGERFTTYGIFENYLVTSVAGLSYTNKDGSVGNDGANITMFNIDNGMSVVKSKTLHTNDLTWDNEQLTFCGIADNGKGEFLTGVIKSDYHKAGPQDGSSIGAISYPDSCWVMAFDKDLNLKRTYRDNRISVIAGRYKSNVASEIATAADGMVYAFSCSFPDTKLLAGALRIKQGATEFDPDYYFNLSEQMDGYSFRRVWNLYDDKFLLEIYQTKVKPSATPDPVSRYGIVDMSEKKFMWVTGMPENYVTSGVDTGEIPLYYNGKIYIPITELGKDAAIYNVNPETGEATLGVTIKGATRIRAIGHLE